MLTAFALTRISTREGGRLIKQFLSWISASSAVRTPFLDARTIECAESL